MILCDNIVFELQRIGGISKYWSNTISRLNQSNRDIVFLEGPGVSGNAYRSQLKLEKTIFRERGSLIKRRIFGPSTGSDIFHSSYYRISSRARSNIVTIHDFMNEKYPKSYRDRFLAQIKKRACLHAKAILVVSERTRHDLLNFYPWVAPQSVHVIYNGVGDEFFRETLDSSFEVGSLTLSPGEYFLYVGTRGYCKNFPFVLRFVAEARAQGLELPLIIVGGGPLSRLELSLASTRGIPADAVHQLSDVSDNVLRRLYSNCLALLIPSIYEGFGLPAAEAARCGALVLSARGSALDEIVGDTDFAFDLQRDGEIARVLSLGLDSSRARTERQRVAERSVLFDWGRSTEKLLEIYNDL